MRTPVGLTALELTDLIRTERVLATEDGDDTVTADIQSTPVIIKSTHHIPALLATGFSHLKNLAISLAPATGNFPAHRFPVFRVHSLTIPPAFVKGACLKRRLSPCNYDHQHQEHTNHIQDI